MIQNLIFVFFFFFLEILFRGYSFIPHVLVDIIRAFIIPEFVAENLKANKYQRKRSLILQYCFARKTSLILRISTLLKLEIICFQNTAKKLSQFTNFPANMFLFGVRKSICTATFAWRPPAPSPRFPTVLHEKHIVINSLLSFGFNI